VHTRIGGPPGASCARFADSQRVPPGGNQLLLRLLGAELQECQAGIPLRSK
jgi:hypothetical protein